MSVIPGSTLADSERLIADLQRQLAECRAERDEAFAQQTATTEVLQIINSSPGDLAPVFDAILEKAHDFCGADHGSLFLKDGEIFHAIASRGMPEAMTGPLREGIHANDLPLAKPLVAGDPFVHVHDSALDEHPNWIKRELDVVSSNRTLLSIPLRKGDALLGMIVAGRFEIRPFTDKQIALLQNFAAQAVIAMENARLFGELRQRTGDLQESLEYQTATSDVLKFISRSTFDLQPVFETIVRTAARLCDADTAFVSNREGDAYRVVASFAASPAFDAFIRGRLLPVNRGNVAGRTVLEHRVVEVDDIAADPEFNLPESVTIGKLRTALGVPLLREGVAVGTINLGRTRVEPFTERQIDLVRTFADQAVIAMENARLISETREALEQ
jgi:two-component system NtrC family sensor kinase